MCNKVYGNFWQMYNPGDYHADQDLERIHHPKVIFAPTGNYYPNLYNLTVDSFAYSWT